MVFPGNTVNTLHGYTLNKDEGIFQAGKQFFGQFALYIFLHQYFIYLSSGLYGFNNSAYTENHFILF